MGRNSTGRSALSTKIILRSVIWNDLVLPLEHVWACVVGSCKAAMNLRFEVKGSTKFGTVF